MNFKLRLGLGETVLVRGCTSLRSRADRDNPSCYIASGSPTEIKISRTIPSTANINAHINFDKALNSKCQWYASLLGCATTLMLVRQDNIVIPIDSGSNFYISCICAFIGGASLQDLYRGNDATRIEEVCDDFSERS
jgi:hypothetical protein